MMHFQNNIHHVRSKPKAIDASTPTIILPFRSVLQCIVLLHSTFNIGCRRCGLSDSTLSSISETDVTKIVLLENKSNLLVRNKLHVDEHERLSNYTLRYKLKVKEHHVFAAARNLIRCVHARKYVSLRFVFTGILVVVVVVFVVCLFVFFTMYCYIISDKPKKQRQRNKLPKLYKIEHCKYNNNFVCKGLRSMSPSSSEKGR